jgi:hypothetical protein
MSQVKPRKQYHRSLPLTVTQSELQTIRGLRAVMEFYGQLRADLLDRLELGAAVEPGPLTARVTTAEIRRPSWPVLIELLGRAEVRRLRARIPGKVHQQLRVTPVKPVREE